MLNYSTRSFQGSVEGGCRSLLRPKRGTHLRSRGRRCSRGIFGDLSGWARAIHRGYMVHGYHSGEHRLDIWDGYDMVKSPKKATYQLVTGDRFLCQQNLDTYLDEYPEIKLKLRFLKDSQDVWGTFGAPQPTKPTYQLPAKQTKPMGLVS